METLNLKPKEYYLATIHRAENTDDYERLKEILTALSQLDKPVIFPIHPRTKSKVKEYNLEFLLKKIQVIDPVGYLDMVNLEKNAKAILTDSGGIQKEAFWLKVPCITLRDETEWVETVKFGWNTLAGANMKNIIEKMNNISFGVDLNFEEKHAVTKIFEVIKDLFGRRL